MQRAGILLLLCGCAAAEVLTIREAARLAQHAAHATRAGSPHQHLRGGQHAAAPRARSGGRVSSCPTSLNTTTWSERRRAQPRVSYRDATPADMVVGKADSLVAQDSNMKWWPITITARNADGNTWTAAVMDGTGEQQWDSVWPQFVRVKVVSPPLTEFEDVRLSACSAFDPQCASHLHPAGLRGMDADCAEHLPHAAWSGFNADQGRQIPPAALAALPAGACQMLSAGVAEGVACERVRFSEDCARSLSTPALEMLSPLCISRIPAPAFATYDGDQVSSLLKGLGSGGLQPGQIRGLSTDGCLTIGNDWGAVRDLGAQGDAVCLALAGSCWETIAKQQPQIEDIPTRCLTQLPAGVVALLASPANIRQDAEAKGWCAHGPQALASMSEAARAAVPPAACGNCLVTGGVAGQFPQCLHASAVGLPGAGKMARLGGAARAGGLTSS
eukprot:TRINITY_DN2447_c0_g1_i1.p1 TRINITY_DN2447_c0_g1~~TRINITY_DN2447_c0_g1_i1.p1  ORF type:complete len:470 (+),score=141.25 TRINITY_DN2447_c0_g1_i1:78-1412(+)